MNLYNKSVARVLFLIAGIGFMGSAIYIRVVKNYTEAALIIFAFMFFILSGRYFRQSKPKK